MLLALIPTWNWHHLEHVDDYLHVTHQVSWEIWTRAYRFSSDYSRMSAIKPKRFDIRKDPGVSAVKVESRHSQLWHVLDHSIRVVVGPSFSPHWSLAAGLRRGLCYFETVCGRALFWYYPVACRRTRSLVLPPVSQHAYPGGSRCLGELQACLGAVELCAFDHLSEGCVAAP